MDVKELLTEWGEWQRSLDGVGIGSGLVGSYREPTPPGTGTGIDNQRAGKFDIVIAKMMNMNRDYYRVVSSVYIYGRPLILIAEEMKTNASTVRNIRIAAEAYLQCYIDLLGCPEQDIYKIRLIN